MVFIVFSTDVNVTYDKLNPISFAYKMKDITQGENSLEYLMYNFSLVSICFIIALFVYELSEIDFKNISSLIFVFFIACVLISIYYLLSLMNHTNPGELVETEFSFFNLISIFYGYLKIFSRYWKNIQNITLESFYPINIIKNLFIIIYLFVFFFIFLFLGIVFLTLCIDIFFGTSYCWEEKGWPGKNVIDLFIIAALFFLFYCMQPRWYSKNLNKTYLYGEEFINKMKKERHRKENQR